MFRIAQMFDFSLKTRYSWCVKAINKAYKFRFYPSKAAQTKLDTTFRLCWELWNAALDERRSAYEQWRKFNTGTEIIGVVGIEGVLRDNPSPKPKINYYTQANQLAEIKEIYPEFKQVHSQVLQDVLKRLDKAFDNFFRRVKAGETPGYPRFKGKNRFNSVTFPQGGWSLSNDKLSLSKIGTVKVKLHREVLGKVKTVTLKKDGNQWYVIFSVETEIEIPAFHEGGVVGIDLGIEHFANLSNGEQVDNPRFFRKAQKHLAKAQRKWDKVKQLKKGNPLRQKPGKVVTRAHRKVRNCRADFAHKLSKTLVETYRLIAVENLVIKALAAGMLAKSVNDAGWGQFLQMLNFKAENAGSRVVVVDPRYTSQTCPECGIVRKKELSERWHSCECGCEMHRDRAAALVIFSRGLATVRNQPLEAPAI